MSGRTEATERDQFSPERFTFMAGSLAALVGVVCVVAQRASSQFYADDYLYLQLAEQGELTPSWLVVDNYGHFAPLTRLAYFVVQRTVGLDYAVAALLPAALTACIALTLAWLFRELLGRRWSVLGLAVLGATSVPLLRTVLWFGAAIHVLGAAAMMTLCVAAFVVHLRRQQERYRLLSLAALVAGLLVQERPMITIGYLVLIRYLFALGAPALRPAGAFLRREARLWTPYVVVELSYLVYRMGFFPSSPQPGNARDASEFIGLSVVRGWAPSLVGSRVLPFEPYLTAGVVAGLVGVVALVAVLAATRRGWWRAGAFLALIYLANLGIVAVGRLNVADLKALATDLQYYVDVHIGTLLAFVLGFALLPARSVGSRKRVGWPLRLAVPVAALALAVSTASTWRAILDGNNQTAAHGYVNTAQGQLHDESQSYALMRTKLPLSVAPSFIDPFTDVTAVFGLDHEVAALVHPAAERRLVVLDTGRVTEAHPSTPDAIEAPSPRIEPGLGNFENTPDGACLSGAAGAYYKVKLPRPAVGRGFFFAVTYTSDVDLQLRASTRGGGPAAYNWSETTLPAGEDRTVVDRLEGASIRVVNLVFDEPIEDVCLTRVWVGRLAVTSSDGQCHTLDDYAVPLGRASTCELGWDELSGGSQALRWKTSSRPRSVSQGAESVKQRHSSPTSGAR